MTVFFSYLLMTELEETNTSRDIRNVIPKKPFICRIPLWLIVESLQSSAVAPPFAGDYF
jgi:hypothetical protein